MKPKSLIFLYVLICLLIGTTVVQANPLAFQVKTATPTKPPTSTKTPIPTKTPTPTNTPTNTPTVTSTPTNTAIPERIIKECSTGKGVKTFGHPTKIVTYTFSLSLECIKQLQNGQSVTPMVEAKLYVIGAGDGCVAGSTAGTFKTDGVAQSTIRNNDKGEPAWLDVTVEYPPTNDSYWDAYWCQRVKVVFQQDLPPTIVPTPKPTTAPTQKPTVNPTQKPTVNPTSVSTVNPTSVPTVNPTSVPTVNPTSVSTVNPTSVSTVNPTSVPTVNPTSVSTVNPTSVSTANPTPKPTTIPTQDPTPTPQPTPTNTPVFYPTSPPGPVFEGDWNDLYSTCPISPGKFLCNEVGVPTTTTGYNGQYVDSPG